MANPDSIHKGTPPAGSRAARARPALRSRAWAWGAIALLAVPLAVLGSHGVALDESSIAICANAAAFTARADGPDSDGRALTPRIGVPILVDGVVDGVAPVATGGSTIFTAVGESRRLVVAWPPGTLAAGATVVLGVTDSAGDPFISDGAAGWASHTAMMSLTAGTCQLEISPDLTIAKTHAGSLRAGDKGRTYTITVGNAGAGPTSGPVTVADSLPAGLAAVDLAGAGWACTLATLSCTRADALPAGSSYPPITLTIDVAVDAPSLVTNTATVAGGGDANPANNSASDATPIAGIADLTLTKTHTGNFARGQVGARYTITVTNAGPGPTIGTVSVIDTLPGDLKATAMGGTGWTCALAALTCTRADTLAAAASYPPITLTVTVSRKAPKTLVNAATVSGGGEINASNNKATDTAVVDRKLAAATELDAAAGLAAATDPDAAEIEAIPALHTLALLLLAALLAWSGMRRAQTVAGAAAAARPRPNRDGGGR